jgi:hypothetical protein
LLLLLLLLLLPLCLCCAVTLTVPLRSKCRDLIQAWSAPIFADNDEELRKRRQRERAHRCELIMFRVTLNTRSKQLVKETHRQHCSPPRSRLVILPLHFCSGLLTHSMTVLAVLLLLLLRLFDGGMCAGSGRLLSVLSVSARSSGRRRRLSGGAR